MLTIWMIYLLAAATSAALFVTAGFRSRRVTNSAAGRLERRAEMPKFTAGSAVNHELPLGDALECIHMALRRLASLIDSQSVRIDVASRHGLLVRLRTPVLTDVLEDLLATALHSAPASNLLVTASAHGDRIHITVADDIPGADLAARQSQVRLVQERVALLGGTLDVQVRPAEGTILTLRLMAAFPALAEAEPAAETTRAGAVQLL